MMYEIKEMENVCANCQHYIQYYAKKIRHELLGYTAVNHGHCTYPRMKDRGPSETCDNFSPRNQLEE